jgi:hypothetical protein
LDEVERNVSEAVGCYFDEFPEQLEPAYIRLLQNGQLGCSWLWLRPFNFEHLEAFMEMETARKRQVSSGS